MNRGEIYIFEGISQLGQVVTSCRTAVNNFKYRVTFSYINSQSFREDSVANMVHVVINR